MNVLLTSVGRRNYMVEYFRKALAPYKGRVHAMNSDIDAVGLWVADEYVQAPLIYDKEYSSFLLTYCKKHDIQMIFSLFDIELPILSKLKEKFLQHDIRVVVGDEWLTQMANDKWETQRFLRSNGFNTTRTFLSLDEFRKLNYQADVQFPVFIKPRWGMGSIGIYKAYNLEEVEFFYRKVKSEIENSYLIFESSKDIESAVLIQESLPGTEYGLDVINDLNGKYYTTIVKRKLAMRAGETDGAIIVEEALLAQIGSQLARITKHPANMDVDVFFDGTTGYVLELNPRFGGGYPFSHQAGVDLPQAVINWYYGKEVDVSKLLSPKIGSKIMKGITMISEKDGDR